jgi:hypothetical protein
MQTKRTQKTPANLFPMLQRAARPGARLLLVGGTAFILNGKAHTHVREAVYKALLEKGWITSPRQIVPDLAESNVTSAGYARLAAMEAHRRKYTQLILSSESTQFIA